jgi:hypothetical protein
MPSAAAPFISPFRTPIAPPFISPPGIPVSHAHFSARPIAIVIKPRTHGKTDPETYHRLDIGCIWLDVYDLGIVLRHVNYVGFGRNNANVALLFDDPLLRSIDQRARCSCLSAQRLN